ncbi:phospho-N-acetylmuramoyl-pentapeptide-transferase [Flexibacter flexilis DSM 6793]|uniref:Phospho-N-acetylmuramoyl-pentapeptide-transferase n=1 Tax=Flexibacter flexilis DSM 6793 TaxID=927664 RepID=A0A1I1M302_9BACT|nr:phospho-N-acetylmuramoyl-pentapeptide-transferase [Flexibacter flexilis]SFC79897.1 phospho-N-acetylmuramoyl-pentapeptide-transferase [Flexibacter flexilis DSM 6793]
MLYHLFGYLDEKFDFFGAGVFKYISFRAVAAIIVSLLITSVYGKRLINYLRYKQVGETVRDLGLDGQVQKQGTPTMGGLIILAGILVPTLLFARIENIYIILLIVSTIWLGMIGFLDDYIKVFKKNKEGLHGRFKIVGQVGLGLIVGTTLYFHNDVRVREYTSQKVSVSVKENQSFAQKLDQTAAKSFKYQDKKSLITTIPFFKNNELDYKKIFSFLGDWTWVGYVVLVIFIITAVSNGANITDGIDGLAAGVSAIIGLTLAILAYVSGNIVFAEYLGIMYIPNSGEMVIFCAAFVGACVGFLWYNSYPAQVFMGDTGSLALGGVIAVIALSIRKELLIPVLCGVFLVENLSVMIQVSYFKYTKKKYGEGRRIFKMSPLHHHYQKLNYHEAKIVTRFWIVAIVLAAITLGTLKLR